MYIKDGFSLQAEIQMPDLNDKNCLISEVPCARTAHSVIEATGWWRSKACSGSKRGVLSCGSLPATIISALSSDSPDVGSHDSGRDSGTVILLNPQYKTGIWRKHCAKNRRLPVRGSGPPARQGNISFLKK